MTRNLRSKKRMTRKKMKLKKKKRKTRKTKAEKPNINTVMNKRKKKNQQKKMKTKLCHPAKVVLVMRNKVATIIVQAKRRMRTVNQVRRKRQEQRMMNMTFPLYCTRIL